MIGVPRHLAMSIGFEFTQYPDAISEMIRNEQIKVKGCRFASHRRHIVDRRSASILLRVSFSGTPALNNMERSVMLFNIDTREQKKVRITYYRY